MLMVLALLPTAGTLCAITCDLAAQPESSGHHHGAAPAAKAPAAPDAPVIGGTSTHPCGHDVVIQQAATGAERAPMTVSAPAVTVIAIEAFTQSPVDRVTPSLGAPPGSAPPTSTPAVLRV